MFRASLKRWIDAPFVTGWLALLCVIAAVALPTSLRAAANGVVTGCEFTPYLPFVLISAILLGWKEAVVVALISVVLLDGLFFGLPQAIHQGPCFLTAAGIFLASSALMIGIVVLVRRIVADLLGQSDRALGADILSLDMGEVWLSRNGRGPPVCLGSQASVSKMMKDFLAQEELGNRLNGRLE